MQNLTWDSAPQTLKVSEAARLSGLHINTIRAAIHDKRLGATKPTGSHWRIQKADLLSFMKHIPRHFDQTDQKLDKIIELLEELISLLSE